MEHEPIPAEHESGLRKNTVDRLNHIVRTAANIITSRSVQIETEHFGISAELKDGAQFYMHAGIDNFSMVQDWELMKPDNYVVFTLKTLIGKKPTDEPYRDVIVSIDKQGIRVSQHAHQQNEDPITNHEDLAWEAPTKTQILGLSVELERLRANKEEA